MPIVTYVAILLLPDCSVCSKNYAPSLSYTCRECSNSAVGIAVATALTLLAAAVGIVIVSHLLSGEMVGSGRGIVDRLTRRVPMHSVKIVIIVWQILTQVRPNNRQRSCISHRFVDIG